MKSAARDAAMIDALCEWFKSNARDLPWRRKRTGYTALVSEAMLQQTQVSRVVDTYRRFMKKFPSVRTLARANEQDVLAMWQGMGYYRRARNLHAAARLIVKRFNGRVPRTVDELRQLPGVGRYTAGAIASIAFGQHEPIVDGNVLRVLARLRCRRGAASDARMIKWTWSQASDLVRKAMRPGVFNEALMELGATVCLPAPNQPKCGQCPVAKWCEARRRNMQNRAPASGVRKKPAPAHHHAVVVTRSTGTSVLVEQRSSRGMWSNMWQVPTIEADHPLSEIELKDALAMPVAELSRIGSFSHATTHRAISFHVYRGTSRSRAGKWRSAKALRELPMSTPQRRIVRMCLNGEAS